MNNAKLYKKILGYFIDLFACAGLACGCLCFIYIISYAYAWVYALCVIILTYIIYAFVLPLIFKLAKGKSFGYLLVGLKLVTKGEQKIPFKTLLIKTMVEGFTFLALIDCLFILTNRTRIGVTERMTGTFIIDD